MVTGLTIFGAHFIPFLPAIYHFLSADVKKPATVAGRCFTWNAGDGTFGLSLNVGWTGR